MGKENLPNWKQIKQHLLEHESDHMPLEELCLYVERTQSANLDCLTAIELLIFTKQEEITFTRLWYELGILK